MPCPVHGTTTALPRPTTTQQGYGGRWQRARTLFLRRYPLCAIHLAQGRVVAAAAVDHIEPHRGEQVLMWDRANWAGLCLSHHSLKTMMERTERARLAELQVLERRGMEMQWGTGTRVMVG